MHGQQSEVHSQSVMAWMVVTLAGVAAGLFAGAPSCCLQAPILPVYKGRKHLLGMHNWTADEMEQLHQLKIGETQSLNERLLVHSVAPLHAVPIRLVQGLLGSIFTNVHDWPPGFAFRHDV